MARSITQICNEAISDLPAHPIVDIEDTTQKEARECARHLPGVVSDLIDAHPFQFVRRRVALAAVTNDRDAEWAYAYALPGGWASNVKLVRNYSSTATPEVVVTPMLYWGDISLSMPVIDYDLADGVLYTNLEEAILEYSTDALEPNKWPPLFAQAVIRTLASRIYRPILGEKADTKELLAKHAAAQRAYNEAVASDLNRNPRRRSTFTSEAAIARQGYGYGDIVWRR
jgi:hypothetical protein